MTAAASYLPRGVHVTADAHEADCALLMDEAFLGRLAQEAAELAGATVLRVDVHKFGEGQGVAGVALLAESHLTFHTWPEHGFAALDAFMCGACDPRKALQHMTDALRARQVKIRVMERGE